MKIHSTFIAVIVYLSFIHVLTETCYPNICDCDIDSIHKGDPINLISVNKQPVYISRFSFPNQFLICKSGKYLIKFINIPGNRRISTHKIMHHLIAPNKAVTAEELRTLILPVNLNKIDVSHNNIGYISFDTFPVHNSVEFLDLSFNHITKLTANSFECLNQMERLHLKSNEITKLPAFLFHTMEKLIELDLSFNKIDQIDSDSFPFTCRLQILNLSYNIISALNMTLFQRFTQMQRLSLSNNQIIELPSNVFRQMEKLVELDLSFNNIVQFADSALSGNFKLQKLDLTQNQLSKLTEKMFASFVELRHLNLTQNRLNEIECGAFSTLENLQTLDVSENRLKRFNLNIFPMQPNQNFKVLNIANNGLGELVNFTSASMPNVVISGIDDNQINCTHFKQIFAALTSKHLNSFKTFDNCGEFNGNSDETKPSEAKSIDISTLGNMEKVIGTPPKTSRRVAILNTKRKLRRISISTDTAAWVSSVTTDPLQTTTEVYKNVPNIPLELTAIERQIVETIENYNSIIANNAANTNEFKKEDDEENKDQFFGLTWFFATCSVIAMIFLCFILEEQRNRYNLEINSNHLSGVWN